MHELVLGERADVHPVQPVELRVVELGRARADPLEREPRDELVAAHDRRLAVRRPAEQREEVDECRRQVAVLAELLGRDGAVPLRELLPVRSEHHRHVRVDRHLAADGADDVDLLRRVRDVVLAADHVRDPVPDVLERRGEVVGRPPVGAEDDDVLDRLVRDLDAAADDVVPAGHALVGHPEPDRALVLVGLALGDEPVGAASRQSSIRSSWNVCGPSQSRPSQRSDSWIWSTASATSRDGVGVLDPEPELAALLAREEPVEERRARRCRCAGSRSGSERYGRGRASAAWYAALASGLRESTVAESAAGGHRVHAGAKLLDPELRVLDGHGAIREERVAEGES